MRRSKEMRVSADELRAIFELWWAAGDYGGFRPVVEPGPGERLFWSRYRPLVTAHFRSYLEQERIVGPRPSVVVSQANAVPPARTVLDRLLMLEAERRKELAEARLQIHRLEQQLRESERRVAALERPKQPDLWD